MTIGEPPLGPLLAPRATCTILHLESAGEPDLSLVGSCGIALWRATIEQDPKVSTIRGRPHWLTYMASLFRCQGAAARHAPGTGREPHVGPVRRTHSAAQPNFPLGRSEMGR